jgi:hypothetical protein
MRATPTNTVCEGLAGTRVNSAHMLLTVVVADPQRMTALRDGLPAPGRVLRFPTSNLASALESIRANQPGLIILDSNFLHGDSGAAFLDRINGLSLQKVILQQAVFDRGHWTMTPLDQAPPQMRPDNQRAIAVRKAGLETRRAPRFLVEDIAQAVADGATVDVVDLSVLGAQVISQPMLRPNQKVRVNLPDSAGPLQLTASVAWSIYEKPANKPRPQFRVGMQFDDAEAATLENYCKRHCKPEPVPIRH